MRRECSVVLQYKRPKFQVDARYAFSDFCEMLLDEFLRDRGVGYRIVVPVS